MVMSLERFGGRFFLVALSGLALSACSPDASTAVPPAQAAAPTRAVAAAPAPVSAPVVTGLPDFTALVDHYGPAVVNVQVTEERQRGQRGGPEGANPNDPFGDFFRRFGIPNAPQQQQPRNQPPARG